MTVLSTTSLYPVYTPETTTNPYVGIRPFGRDDAQFYFGREDQAIDLLGILRRTRFLPVVGSSGCGKSSLVLAGLLPRLLGGFLVGKRDLWRIATCRPGGAPMRNLAAALAPELAPPNESATAEDVEALEAAMRTSLADAVTELVDERLNERTSLLVIVDQFEELFKFRGTDVDDDELPDDEKRRRAAARAEAADFVDLLLGLAADPPRPIYVVLTMRSDFLGDCDVFIGLPEAMNKSRYLVPRLTREQLRASVRAPAMMMGADLSGRLVDFLLNSLGDRQDRLPVLEHALQRTWDRWVSAGRIGRIDLEHLDGVRGLDGALEWDADNALEGLDLSVVERVFRSLTDTDQNRRRIRRACRLSQLVDESGVSDEEVMRVVNAFANMERRNFLFVSADGDRKDPRVDISHEALIRQWPRLRAWVDTEVQQRDTFLRLVRNARDHADERRDLLSERELAVRAKDWDAIATARGWARRYAPASDFDLAEAFVRASREQVERRRREAEAERLREQQRRQARRRLWYVGTAASVVLTVVFAFNFVRARNALADADRELMLAAIRDLSTFDPTMAATLVAELAVNGEDDSRFSWSDVAALGRVANEDVADAVVDSIVSVDASDRDSSYVLLHADGDLEVRRASDDVAPRRVKTGARHARYVSIDASGAIALVSDSVDGLRAVPLRPAGAVRRLTGAQVQTFAPVLSRDGRVALAPCDSASVCTWSTADRSAPAHRLDLPKGCRLIAIDLVRDGSRALTGCADGGVHLWTPETNHVDTIASSVPPPANHGVRGENVSSARFSHDGTMIVRTSYLTGVRLWRDAGGSYREIAIDSVSTAAWYSAAFDAADGQLVIAGDRGAAVYALLERSAQRVKQFPDPEASTTTGSSRWFNGAVFSPKGDWVVSWSLDATTHLWRSADDDGNDSARVIRTGGVAVRRAVFDASGSTLVTIANDTTARIWSMVHDPEPFLWHPQIIEGLIGSSTARRASVNASGTRLAVATGDDAELIVSRISIDPITGVVTRGELDSTASWVHADAIEDVRFDGDRLRVLGTVGDSVIVFREIGGGRGDSLVHVRDSTHRGGLSLDAHGRTVAMWGTGRDTVLAAVWRLGVDSSAIRRFGKLPHEDRREMRVALSPRDDLAVSVPVYYRAPSVLWRTRDGATLRALPTSYAPSVAFDTLGSRLVWSEPDHQLRVWPLAPNAKGMTLRGACCKISDVAFSDDGSMVVAGDTTGGVNLWAPELRSGMLRLQGGTSAVSSVTTGVDRNHVIATDDEGVVRVWTIDAEQLIRRISDYTHACATVSVWMDHAKQSRSEAERRVRACEDRRAKQRANAAKLTARAKRSAGGSTAR